VDAFDVAGWQGCSIAMLGAVLDHARHPGRYRTVLLNAWVLPVEINRSSKGAWSRWETRVRQRLPAVDASSLS
jgi:hypothetical protein